MSMSEGQLNTVFSHEARTILASSRENLAAIERFVANPPNLPNDTAVSEAAALHHHGEPANAEILEARAVSIITDELEMNIEQRNGDDNDDFYSIEPATPSPWSVDSRDL